MQPGRLPAAIGPQARVRAGVAALALKLALALGLTLALLLPAAAPLLAPAGATEGYVQAEAVIHGQVLRLDVADSPAKQALGLGGRAHLGAHEGMVFVYAEKSRQAFWMHGMLIPIDMIWLDNERVVHIEHDVPPPAPGTADAALPVYRPDAPANLVLELAAGRAQALGLRVGDAVQFRFGLR
jgi:uncharacterized membrane protein (UPF0127 family)